MIFKTDNCLYLNKFPLNHFVMKPVSRAVLEIRDGKDL